MVAVMWAAEGKVAGPLGEDSTVEAARGLVEAETGRAAEAKGLEAVARVKVGAATALEVVVTVQAAEGTAEAGAQIRIAASTSQRRTSGHMCVWSCVVPRSSPRLGSKPRSSSRFPRYLQMTRGA